MHTFIQKTVSMYLKPTMEKVLSLKQEYKKIVSDKMQLSLPFYCCDHKTVIVKLRST